MVGHYLDGPKRHRKVCCEEDVMLKLFGLDKQVEKYGNSTIKWKDAPF